MTMTAKRDGDGDDDNDHDDFNVIVVQIELTNYWKKHISTVTEDVVLSQEDMYFTHLFIFSKHVDNYLCIEYGNTEGH